MGVVRDVTIEQLTQAVQGISSAGMTDSTGQDIKDSIDALDMTAGTLAKDSTLTTLNTRIAAIETALASLMTNTTGQAINTTLQSLVGAISPSASNVSFDNTGTGLSASDVQEAIEEVNGKSTVMASGYHNSGASLTKAVKGTGLILIKGDGNTQYYIGFYRNNAIYEVTTNYSSYAPSISNNIITFPTGGYYLWFIIDGVL